MKRIKRKSVWGAIVATAVIAGLLATLGPIADEAAAVRDRIFGAGSSWRVSADTADQDVVHVATEDAGLSAATLCSGLPAHDEQLGLIAVPIQITVDNTGERPFSVSAIRIGTRAIADGRPAPSLDPDLMKAWMRTPFDPTGPGLPSRLDAGSELSIMIWQSWPVRSRVAQTLAARFLQTVADARGVEGELPLAQQCGVELVVTVERSDGAMEQIVQAPPL